DYCRVIYRGQQTQLGARIARPCKPHHCKRRRPRRFWPRHHAPCRCRSIRLAMFLRSTLLKHSSPAKTTCVPGPVMRAWEYWNVRLDKVENNWRTQNKGSLARKNGEMKNETAPRTATLNATSGRCYACMPGSPQERGFYAP